jgi:hypothetical protein
VLRRRGNREVPEASVRRVVAFKSAEVKIKRHGVFQQNHSLCEPRPRKIKCQSYSLKHFFEKGSCNFHT